MSKFPHTVDIIEYDLDHDFSVTPGMTHRPSGVGAGTGNGDGSPGKKGQRKTGMPPGHHHKIGLSVVLAKIPGVTDKKVLRDRFHFQVPPTDEWGWEKGHGYEDYTIIDKGDFSRPTGRQLKTITYNGLFVDYNPSWAVYAGGKKHRNKIEPGGPAPHLPQIGRYLERIMDTGTAIRLIAWNRALYPKPEVDMAVTIRSLTQREKAGEPDARYFNISFTESREPRIRRRRHSKKDSLPTRVTIRKSGQVVDDEGGSVGSANNPATLRRLAKKYYHDPGKWRLIARKNGIRSFGPDEDLGKLARRGQKKRRLKIPKPDRD